MDKLIEQGIKVDMILTDPPYGTTACKWDSVIPFDKMWDRIHKLSNDNTPIVLFGSEPYSSYLRTSNIKQYKYDWYWDKVRGVGHLNAKKQPMKNIETISVFYNKPPTYNPQMRQRDKPRVSRNNNTQEVYGRSQDNFVGETLDKKYPLTLLTYSKSAKEDMMYHSSQKPVNLLEYLIFTYTNEGDTVLDFTMGSGSTGVACKNTERKFIGIELDDTYFKIAEERIEGNI
jgi:site-specific DNA-methyltransferase (adenine-specific)